MKKLVSGILFIGFLILGNSCHQLIHFDDVNPPAPPILPDIAVDFIAENYTDFTIESVEFEDICDDEIVIEVELEDGPGPDVDLYFSTDGIFLFAAFDIAVSDLPDVVITAIETEFADYSIEPDDVERWELSDGTIQYEVKLEPASGSSIEVVFDENGAIVCQDNSGDDNDDDNDGDDNDDDEDNEDDDDHINLGDLPESIMDFINTNYPSYTQINAEFEDPCGFSNVYEVELEDGSGPNVDLYFSLDGEFLFAAWEISSSDLPEAVMNVINTEYADFEIDEDHIEQFEMADGSTRFEVELESDAGSDLEIVFHEDGSIACIDD